MAVIAIYAIRKRLDLANLITFGDNTRIVPMRTVLVVEDSEPEARVLERALRDTIARSTIVLVRSTTDAEHYLFSDASFNGLRTRPDLVVLDVKVPLAGGLDLLKKVRSDARTKAIPVLMMSGELGDQDVQELYRSGANSYLDKPVDSQEFVMMVSTAAHYWLGLNMSVPAGR